MLSIRRKTLSREEWYTDQHRSWKHRYHRDAFFEGAIGLITFTGLPEPEVIQNASGELVIGDNGYQWLEFVPKDEKYVATVMVNQEGKIFQIYLDMTIKNEVTEDGDAAFFDAFLDVVVAGDERPRILDLEELEEALRKKLITEDEYDEIIKTGDRVVAEFENHRENIMKQLYEYLAMMRNIR